MVHTSSPTSKRILLNESADLQLPLRGCVICCTSVADEKRTEIAQWADQMGAIHRYDLTLDVTHLIIADYKTDKYRYVARERQDVQPMTIQWIESIRELWMNDKDIDFSALETQYRLPTFHSLRFSMTGCDDPRERLEISEQVKANGATYEGDLTKHITHLISFRTEGAKYKAAKQWGLKIVSAEWLRDSIERGMILDEKLYDPALPLEERGKGAWDRTKPKRVSLGKRSREGSVAEEGGRRKLRRTASMKLNNQNADMWGDIVGGGTVAQVSRSGIWDTEEAAPLQNIKQPRATESTATTNSSTQSTVENPPIRGMFSGCRFFIYGFPQKKDEILRTHLTSNGAEISSSIENLINTAWSGIRRVFRIVPPGLHIRDYPALPESQLEVETITYWWVERCLHAKRFLEPSDCIIGRPFSVFPIEGFHGMTISSSAFSGIEIRHVKEAVEMIGASYSEQMTPQISVLVTKSTVGLRRDKSNYAQEWNLPILKADWLWNSIEAGRRLPWADYQLRTQRRRTDSLPATKEAVAKPVSRPERSKSEVLKPVTTSSSSLSSNAARPPRNSRLDDDAFADDKPRRDIVKPSRASRRDDTAFSKIDDASLSRPTPHSEPDDRAFPDEEEDHGLKEEQVTQAPSFPDASSTQDLPIKVPPLSERSVNSPTRTISTAPLPSDPLPKPKEDLSNAISNLLAKTKSAAPTTSDSDSRRRGGNRILGRVTSNVSATSTRHSRGTSVDSTASHGHPVQRPSYVADKTANEHIDMLINDRAQRAENVESQPSNTQVQYEDPESTTARELVMARMTGKVLDPKRIGVKERAPTIGELASRNTRRSGRAAGFNR